MTNVSKRSSCHFSPQFPTVIGTPIRASYPRGEYKFGKLPTNNGWKCCEPFWWIFPQEAARPIREPHFQSEDQSEHGVRHPGGDWCNSSIGLTTWSPRPHQGPLKTGVRAHFASELRAINILNKFSIFLDGCDTKFGAKYTILGLIFPGEATSYLYGG